MLRFISFIIKQTFVRSLCELGVGVGSDGPNTTGHSYTTQGSRKQEESFGCSLSVQLTSPNMKSTITKYSVLIHTSTYNRTTIHFLCTCMTEQSLGKTVVCCSFYPQLTSILVWQNLKQGTLL